MNSWQDHLRNCQNFIAFFAGLRRACSVSTLSTSQRISVREHWCGMAALRRIDRNDSRRQRSKLARQREPHMRAKRLNTGDRKNLDSKKCIEGHEVLARLFISIIWISSVVLALILDWPLLAHCMHSNPLPNDAASWAADPRREGIRQAHSYLSSEIWLSLLAPAQERGMSPTENCMRDRNHIWRRYSDHKYGSWKSSLTLPASIELADNWWC